MSIIATDVTSALPRPQDEIVFPDDNDNLDDRYYNQNNNNNLPQRPNRPGRPGRPNQQQWGQQQPWNNQQQQQQRPWNNQQQQQQPQRPWNNQGQQQQGSPDQSFWPFANQPFVNQSPNRPRPPTTARPVIPSAIGPRPSECETNCLTTNQYNPVCATDNVTYNNIGRFDCAVNCGKSEFLHMYSPGSFLIGVAA